MKQIFKNYLDVVQEAQVIVLISKDGEHVHMEGRHDAINAEAIPNIAQLNAHINETSSVIGTIQQNWLIHSDGIWICCPLEGEFVLVASLQQNAIKSRALFWLRHVAGQLRAAQRASLS